MKRGQTIYLGLIALFLITILFVSGCGTTNLGGYDREGYTGQGSYGARADYFGAPKTTCEKKTANVINYFENAGFPASDFETEWIRYPVGCMRDVSKNNSVKAYLFWWIGWANQSDIYCSENTLNLDVKYSNATVRRLDLGAGCKLCAISYYYNNKMNQDMVTLYMTNGKECYRIEVDGVNARNDESKLETLAKNLYKDTGW